MAVIACLWKIHFFIGNGCWLDSKIRINCTGIRNNRYCAFTNRQSFQIGSFQSDNRAAFLPRSVCSGYDNRLEIRIYCATDAVFCFFCTSSCSTAVTVADNRSIIISAMADYFVITNGNSASQVQALVENVKERMHKAGYSLKQQEGSCRDIWVLLDFNDVIVNVFDKKIVRFIIWREFEATENL